MSQPDDPALLKALRTKIDSMKSGRMEEEPAISEASKVGRGLHMATELLAAVGVGGVMGYLIDMWVNSSPIFFILFFFLGFAAGVRNILRNYNDTL